MLTVDEIMSYIEAEIELANNDATLAFKRGYTSDGDWFLAQECGFRRLFGELTDKLNQKRIELMQGCDDR